MTFILDHREDNNQHDRIDSHGHERRHRGQAHRLTGVYEPVLTKVFPKLTILHNRTVTLRGAEAFDFIGVCEVHRHFFCPQDGGRRFALILITLRLSACIASCISTDNLRSGLRAS